MCPTKRQTYGSTDQGMDQQTDQWTQSHSYRDGGAHIRSDTFWPRSGRSHLHMHLCRQLSFQCKLAKVTTKLTHAVRTTPFHTRSAHSFAFSALLSSLARSAALIHSFAYSFYSSISCHFNQQYTSSRPIKHT